MTETGLAKPNDGKIQTRAGEQELSGWEIQVCIPGTTQLRFTLWKSRESPFHNNLIETYFLIQELNYDKGVPAIQRAIVMMASNHLSESRIIL